MRESLGALREREFRLLFTGQLISLLGDGFTAIALAFAVLDATGSARDLGFVFAARTVPLVLFLLVGGVFADRLSRRTVMLVADGVRAACQGGTAALVLTGSVTLWQFLVLQAVAGTATAFFNPASTGLVPMTVSEERLQQANALRGISTAISVIAGMAGGGIVVTVVGPGWALVVDGASFAVSACFLSLMRVGAHAPLEPQSFLGDLRDGWREFVAQTWVWVFVVGASVGNMLGSIWYVLGAVIAKESLGGPAAWTVILLGFSGGSLLGGVLALRVRPQRPLLVSGSLALAFAVPPLLLAAQLPAIVIGLGALVSGTAGMLSNTLWETTLQHRIPRHALSRVSAYDWFGSLVFQPIGLTSAGLVAGAIGARTTLVAAGIAQLVSTAAIVSVPSVRQLTDEPT